MKKLELKLLELQYKYNQMFKEEYNIFPEYWFDNNNDIKHKINILEQAINKKTLIINIKGANKYVEEVIFE